MSKPLKRVTEKGPLTTSREDTPKGEGRFCTFAPESYTLIYDPKDPKTREDAMMLLMDDGTEQFFLPENDYHVDVPYDDIISFRLNEPQETNA